MDKERIITRIMGEEDECPGYGIDLKTGKLFTTVEMKTAIDAMLVLMVPEEERYRFLNTRVTLMNAGQAYYEGAGEGGKIEYASPECLGPYELARYVTAGTRIISNGVESYLRDHRDIVFRVYKTNCGSDITSGTVAPTCGSHANYLMRRTVTYTELKEKLVPFVASRGGLTGNGWLAYWEDSLYFLFSQRSQAMADLPIESSNTTMNPLKPFINTRDEPHADKDRWRRLHDISGNHNLSEKQIVLKHGAFDCVLAAIEDGFLTPPPLPADPDCPDYTHASKRFNQDIACIDGILTTDGTRWTWLTYQRYYVTECKRYFAACPEALTDERKRVLALWEDTLNLCEAQDFASLARYLDWASHLWYFVRPAVKKLGFDWRAIFASGVWPGVPSEAKITSDRGIFSLRERLLQIIIEYNDINLTRSLYELLVAHGKIDRIFTDEEIQDAMDNPSAVRPSWRNKVIRWLRTHEPPNYIRTIYDIGWNKIGIRDARPDNPNQYRYGYAVNEDPYSPDFDGEAFERELAAQPEVTFSTDPNNFCDEE